LAYELTQEQQILRETIRDFAQSEVAPLASEIDWNCSVPKQLIDKLPNLGLFGISIPTEFGGAGADFLSLMIACEEISKASGSLGAQLSFHNAVVCEALSASTNASLKQRFLQKLASGTFGAFDFSSLEKPRQVKGRIEDDALIVDGALEYVTSAADADIFLIYSTLADQTNQGVLFCFSSDEVKEPNDSFSVGAPLKLMGMRATGTAKISFNKFSVPLDALICEISRTGDYVSQLLARARLAVASQALGIAQASIDAGVKYANERKQFDSKIGSFYAVQNMIATDGVEVETARCISYLTASEIRTSKSLQRDSAIAKIASSNAAVKSARDAIRIHGGYGFTRSYPVERFARDARLTQIYAETNEDLKVLVARQMLG
jgi:alkylation response protein AidB-like acyl-CoA dehydrogenase